VPELGHKRWAETLRRLGSMTGEDVLTTVSPDLGIAVVLENDRPENAFLGHEFYQVGRLVRAAVVGELSWVGIRNPANSGVVVIVEAMTVDDSSSTPIAVSANYTQDTSDPEDTTISGPFNRDTRLDGIAAAYVGTAVLNGGSAAAQVGRQFWNIVVNAPRPSDSPFPYILDAGHSIQIWRTALNGGTGVNVRWRERPLERYEARR
jgi:hypothetical protein